MVTARRRWSASANSPGEEVAGTSVVTSEREKGKTGHGTPVLGMERIRIWTMVQASTDESL